MANSVASALGTQKQFSDQPDATYQKRLLDTNTTPAIRGTNYGGGVALAKSLGVLGDALNREAIAEDKRKQEQFTLEEAQAMISKMTPGEQAKLDRMKTLQRVQGFNLADNRYAMANLEKAIGQAGAAQGNANYAEKYGNTVPENVDIAVTNYKHTMEEAYDAYKENIKNEYAFRKGFEENAFKNSLLVANNARQAIDDDNKFKGIQAMGVRLNDLANTATMFTPELFRQQVQTIFKEGEMYTANSRAAVKLAQGLVDTLGENSVSTEKLNALKDIDIFEGAKLGSLVSFNKSYNLIADRNDSNFLQEIVENCSRPDGNGVNILDDNLVKDYIEKNASKYYQTEFKDNYNADKNDILADYNGDGITWIKQGDRVSTKGIHKETAVAMDMLGKWFYDKTGTKLVITSATDGSSHVDGQYSHYNGYKFDCNDWGNGENKGFLVTSTNDEGSMGAEFIAYAQSLGLEANYEDIGNDNVHIDVSAGTDAWKTFVGTQGNSNGAVLNEVRRKNINTKLQAYKQTQETEAKRVSIQKTKALARSVATKDKLAEKVDIITGDTNLSANEKESLLSSLLILDKMAKDPRLSPSEKATLDTYYHNGYKSDYALVEDAWDKYVDSGYQENMDEKHEQAFIKSITQLLNFKETAIKCAQRYGYNIPVFYNEITKGTKMKEAMEYFDTAKTDIVDYYIDEKNGDEEGLADYVTYMTTTNPELLQYPGIVKNLLDYGYKRYKEAKDDGVDNEQG